MLFSSAKTLPKECKKESIILLLESEVEHLKRSHKIYKLELLVKKTSVVGMSNHTFLKNIISGCFLPYIVTRNIFRVTVTSHSKLISSRYRNTIFILSIIMLLLCPVMYFPRLSQIRNHITPVILYFEEKYLYNVTIVLEKSK